MTHAQEMLRRTEERMREKLRGLTDDELKSAAQGARPWRLKMIRDEWEMRQRRRQAQRKSVYYWLRHPAL